MSASVGEKASQEHERKMQSILEGHDEKMRAAESEREDLGTRGQKNQVGGVPHEQEDAAQEGNFKNNDDPNPNQSNPEETATFSSSMDESRSENPGSRETENISKEMESKSPTEQNSPLHSRSDIAEKDENIKGKDWMHPKDPERINSEQQRQQDSEGGEQQQQQPIPGNEARDMIKEEEGGQELIETQSREGHKGPSEGSASRENINPEISVGKDQQSESSETSTKQTNKPADLKKQISQARRVKLNDGKTEIPVFGLGTYRMEPGKHTEEIVKCALKMGYVHIDTAQYYHNEADVGKAIRECGIKRENIFVTSKMPTKEKSPNDPKQHAIDCVDQSLKSMGLDYIDLYLLHSPHFPQQRVKRWEGLIECVRSGKVKAIGVSNFGIKHLKELLNSEIKPAVNQIEINPFITREDLRHFCDENDIRVVAYSPLAKARRFGEECLRRIADNHGISQAQVMIRWCLQRDLICIMKSDSEEHLYDNAQALDDKDKLSDEDLENLDELDEHYVTEWDPISEVP